MQTQTSNSLHNAIMEAGSKDRLPMLAPAIYIQWKSRIKHYIDTKPNRELIHYCLENPPYELGWKDKFILDAEGNPTTPEWQRFVTVVKQSQELKHVSYHKLYDILKQHQHEVNEIQAEKIAQVANPLALKIYKPTNNNLHTSSNTSRANQDNSPWIHINAGYEGQRSGTVAGARDTVVRDLDSGEKFKTSTLEEIVSLEKSNKNVIGLRSGIPRYFFLRLISGYIKNPWLLLMASLSCYASVIATSKRAARLLALEVVAGCLPLAEVDSLGPTTAVRGVNVVLELLLVFRTLALGLEQTDGEAMINSIQNCDQPLPVIAQVSLAGNAQNAPPTLKDPKFWTAEEKKT
nr:hypothetical protein [Tanacetum cinerariifolium]